MYSQNYPRPHIRIIEQPQKSLRYRYECERRTGTIPGASSTSKNKTHCAIQVVGYYGKAVVVVSCVTKDEPYKPHPHSLVGEHCKKGVCTFEIDITAENSHVTFRKLGVQCIKKNGLREALRVREELNIDPFLTGFTHKDQLNSIDLSIVRLCFQVFVRCGDREVRLAPVVSDPIHNRKTFPDPDILRLSHCNCYVDGGRNDIILLCSKVDKDDIKVCFFETKNNQVIWSESVNEMQIYNSTALCFRPPKYHSLEIEEPVTVLIQLFRPSDGATSKSLNFEYLPLSSEPGVLKEKRRKYSNANLLFGELLGTEAKLLDHSLALVNSTSWNFPQINYNPIVSSTSENQGPNWNITTNDLSGVSDVNIESASEINRLLDIDCQQIELEPIHLSSGDLEMFDVDRLSGNLQENLSLSDIAA